MNKKGTGMAMIAMPPKRDIAGPTPRLWNMGVAARGNEAAKALLRSVLADVALAAYNRYVSTRKLMHCWKMMLKPAPMKTAANTGTIPDDQFSTIQSPSRITNSQCIFGSAVQPNQNNPMAKTMPPTAIGAQRASGTGFPPAASTSLAYRG